MRPPRLILLVFCVIFCPILFTFFSVLSSSPRVATPNALAGRPTGLHALFSFNIPTSLFPPSAIISLTDDNSTFFLARPAAFGPVLPNKGLSGQLWVGSGFGEGSPAAGAEGELGCSDIPGWGEGDSTHYKQDKSTSPLDKTVGPGNDLSQGNRRTDTQQETDSQTTARVEVAPPSTDDGTDDHLHHPLHESNVADIIAPEKHGDHSQTRPATHADIQSIQESAEIAGKVVLLSRGGCGFLEKVKWVQRRGGIGLIVGDNIKGGSLVTMYARGDTSNVTIPALFTSHTTAHLLSSLIPPQAGEDMSQDDGSKGSRTKQSTQSSATRIETSTMTPIVPTPTSARQPSVDEPPHGPHPPKTGVFRSFLSLLGLSGHPSYPPKDSRRPPSSGNINWVLMDTWDEEEASPFEDMRAPMELGRGRPKPGSATKGSKNTGSKTSALDGDGFVIGVHDWRDPDLVAPKSNALPSPSIVPVQENTKSQKNDKGSNYASATLKGGSITPGSGEYRNVAKSSLNKDAGFESSINQNRVAGAQTSKKGWFSRYFSWANDEDIESSKSSSLRPEHSLKDRKSEEIPHASDRQGLESEHEGLWVTLTPTSMSTSPFFDTLLVLVVSPLLTLTVVYALLLLRSRIRRRRWRAPKSIVARLPVRTYHTIASSSSSTASSPRASSPGSASPTSPLLASEDHPESPVSRNRLQRSTGQASDSRKISKKAESSKGEKTSSGSTLWRRKYTGRQVECVVCLEEYVDGESRVMSLPCGHEFHAECITPWLTTRRRTCPICKGDVVRSMSRSVRARETENDHAHELESHQGASSAPVPISGLSEDDMSDMEQHADSDTRLLEGQASSAPPSTWRNLASSFNFSVLSGDTIWHQVRADRNR